MRFEICLVVFAPIAVQTIDDLDALCDDKPIKLFRLQQLESLVDKLKDDDG
jgi:hypothetical protein